MREGHNAFSQPGSGERGFSLIELLIAVVVITVGLVSIVGISAYVSRANATSNQLNVMASVAQDQVDRLRTVIWTQKSDNDKSIHVGGVLPSVYPVEDTPPEDTPPEDTPPEALSASPSAASVSPTSSTPSTYSAPSPIAQGIYVYTLDTTDPATNPMGYHHATVSNTPIGNMEVYWLVAAGPTPDTRNVTIRVVRKDAPIRGEGDWFDVSTIIKRD